MARLMNVGQRNRHWKFRGTKAFVTCHDARFCLLPRRINEVIVPQLDRNVARWWAFLKP